MADSGGDLSDDVRAWVRGYYLGEWEVIPARRNWRRLVIVSFAGAVVALRWWSRRAERAADRALAGFEPPWNRETESVLKILMNLSGGKGPRAFTEFTLALREADRGGAISRWQFFRELFQRYCV